MEANHVRQLYPVGREESADDVYVGLTFPPPPPGRPVVYLGMITSVDGGAVVDGRSGALGGAADLLAFRRLRESADAVLVGAGTARTEDYGPPRLDEAATQRRLDSGRPAAPRLVLVTRRFDLDPGARVFGGPPRPIVATSHTSEHPDEDAVARVADILREGETEVDLAAILGRLAEMGVQRLLCEGGPRLNGSLLAAGLVDEVFVTIAPKLTPGATKRITAGDPSAGLADLELVALREHDGELLARYRVR